MQLKPLIIFVSSIAISWAASIEEVLSDINAIQNGLGMLDNAIKGFTNSLAGALVNNFRFLLSPVLSLKQMTLGNSHYCYKRPVRNRGCNF